jgi:hypothetical protein
MTRYELAPAAPKWFHLIGTFFLGFTLYPVNMGFDFYISGEGGVSVLGAVVFVAGIAAILGILLTMSAYIASYRMKRKSRTLSWIPNGLHTSGMIMAYFGFSMAILSLALVTYTAFMFGFTSDYQGYFLAVYTLPATTAFVLGVLLVRLFPAKQKSVHVCDINAGSGRRST